MTEAAPAVPASVLEAAQAEDWETVYTALADAVMSGAPDPGAIRLFAGAAYFTGRPEEASKAWERAHRHAVKTGDRAWAAETAAEVASQMLEADLLTPALAWAATGERFLEGLPESPLSAMFPALRSTAFMARGDLDEALTEARRSDEIAQRFEEPNVRMLASLGLGQVLILVGEVREGLERIDRAVLGATSGNVDPFYQAMVFCKAMCSWQAVSDYERADQWSEAMRLLCETHDVGGGLRGRCRVHRAQVLRMRGACDRASDEINTALEELGPYSGSGEKGWIMSELGGTRLRLGDLHGAETAFSRSHELGWEPQLGRARLALARGDVATATSIVGDALDNPNDLPSFETPPHTELRRAPLLAAQTEIAVAAGDLDRAARAAGELSGIAERYGSKALHATASGARGELALAHGDVETGRRELETAVRTWASLNTPYETAVARVPLARALHADGRTELALQELQAAGATFERLGAKLDARRVAELAGAMAPMRAGARETRVFMFTDIVGSTNLAEALGDEAWEHVIRWHNDTISKLVAEHGAELVRGTGDGFFVTFEEPASAVDCAIAIQRALDRHRTEHGFAPRVRIGLHLTEATRDGADWAGVGVHAAARIGALAGGEEVLASRATAEAAGQGRTLSEPRTESLKGIAEPVEVVSIDWR